MSVWFPLGLRFKTQRGALERRTMHFEVNQSQVETYRLETLDDAPTEARDKPVCCKGAGKRGPCFAVLILATSWVWLKIKQEGLRRFWSMWRGYAGFGPCLHSPGFLF